MRYSQQLEEAHARIVRALPDYAERPRDQRGETVTYVSAFNVQQRRRPTVEIRTVAPVAKTEG